MFTDKTEIADPSRLDDTDGLAELFDTSYNDEVKDTDFDPDLAERFDGIAHRDDLNDPIHGEKSEEGEAEDEEGDESGSGVNPKQKSKKPSKPSKSHKKIRRCNNCCSNIIGLKRLKLCKSVDCQTACSQPWGGRRNRGGPRDDPRIVHFIEAESAGHY